MTNGTHRSRSDIAMLVVILLLVIALIVWFFTGRSADEGRIDIDVPELPEGGNR